MICNRKSLTTACTFSISEGTNLKPIDVYQVLENINYYDSHRVVRNFVIDSLYSLLNERLTEEPRFMPYLFHFQMKLE